MPTMMGIVFFLALCLVMHPFMLLTHANDDEADALIAFKNSLRDPNYVLRSWDPNYRVPCTWFHVQCDNSGHVTRVDLGNSHLSGHLVAQLGNLKNLKYLLLNNNNLMGSIPAELGNLTELKILNLTNNKLGGCFPLSVVNLVGERNVTIDINNNNGFCIVSNTTCTCP